MKLSHVNALAGLITLASCVSASAPTFSTIQPDATEIAAAAATASSYDFKQQPYVQGKAYNRIITIWLENTDYDKAAGQSGLKALGEKGMVLTNYFALTHPSEPNYMGSVGGDYFGLGNDAFSRLPENVSTTADLLDFKKISWGEYQEHMPYSGYQGYEYLNQKTKANDYVRKHNPLVFYDSVADYPERLSHLKNFTMFYEDLANEALPQWAFITPNMTNDGHDTNIQVSGDWSYDFLTPLLENEYFMKDTLVILTFDENETYEYQNNIWAVLLGVPDEYVNTTDDTYYDHYSLIASVSANWGLPTLGRYDCGANVLKPIADKTGYSNKFVNTSNLYANQSVDGWLSNASHAIAAPNLTCIGAGGLPSLAKINETWYEWAKHHPCPYSGEPTSPFHHGHGYGQGGFGNGNGNGHSGFGSGGHGNNGGRW